VTTLEKTRSKSKPEKSQGWDDIVILSKGLGVAKNDYARVSCVF